MTSLLEHLNLTPAQVAALASNPRRRLLYFLVRWEAYAEALSCLAQEADLGRLVSLQDLQAQALDGLGRQAEAIGVLETRLAAKHSPTAEVQLGRLYLNAGDLGRAEEIAQRLIEANGPVQVLALLGDIRLQQGAVDAAEAAFVRHEQRTPQSRAPLFGLMQVHYRRRDLVTAAAYAVRAYTVEEEGHEPSVTLVRDLRDWFERLGDANRLEDANRQLRERFASELAGIKGMLEGDAKRSTGRPRTGEGKQQKDRASGEVIPPISPPTPLADIPVSRGERRTIEKGARELFGFEELLPAQVEVMACVRRGEHVLAVLPTGAGKSLCYKLPAMLDEGASLVISPLIALMKDQVDKLPPKLQARAIAINSSLDGRGLQKALEDVAAEAFDLIFAAPERLRQPAFLYALGQGRLARLVIDEAHCVSIWGHDFRPDYLAIAQAHRALGAPPILALTATAPPRVRADIERRLFGVGADGKPPAGVNMRVIVADTYRPNLRLSAIPASGDDDKRRTLLGLCKSLRGPGIIYARTRQKCEDLAEMLRLQKIDAAHYHAGLNDRSALQDRFMRGDIRIIVATVAFGMGIDKPDIRFIIHYGLPDSVESYYQEAGRAGRDGKPADCILLHSPSDKAMLTRWANQNLIAKEFLRDVYAAVQRHVAGRPPSSEVRNLGAVSLEALARELGKDDTSVRVALSVLEQAGLLNRHQDVPARVVLWLRGIDADPDLSRFAQLASLRPRTSLTYAYLQLCDLSGIAPDRLEWQLQQWQSAGHLRLSPAGRQLLLSLLPPPADTATRIDSLLSRYAAIQKQRLAEIVAYARSRRCRHGYLANYLGGTPRPRCDACDVCTGHVPGQSAALDLPPESAQLLQILAALSKSGWGHRNLVRILHGEAGLPDRARSSPAFGALTYRSGAEIERLIDRLISAGCIAENELSHGGIALGLTDAGWQAVREGRVFEVG